MKKLTVLGALLAGLVLVAFQGSLAATPPASPAQAVVAARAATVEPGASPDLVCRETDADLDDVIQDKPDRCPPPPTCPTTLNGCPMVSCCCYHCSGSPVYICI